MNEEQMKQLKEMFPHIKNSDFIEFMNHKGGNSLQDSDYDKLIMLNDKRREEEEKKKTSEEDSEILEIYDSKIKSVVVPSIKPKEPEQPIKPKEPEPMPPKVVNRKQQISIKYAPDILSKDILRDEQNQVTEYLNFITSLNFDLPPVIPDDELDEVKKPIIVHAFIKDDIIDVNFNFKNRKPSDIRGIILSSDKYQTQVKLDFGKNNNLRQNTPRYPGAYVFKVYLNDGSVVESNTIHVERKDKLYLTIRDKDPNKKIREVTVSWNIVVTDTSKKDRIILRQIKGRNQIRKEFYVKDNSITFELPRIPGDYIIEYWSNNMKEVIATSEVITVENHDRINAYYKDGKITITWDIYSIDPSTNDWIAVVRKGDSFEKFLMSEYVKPGMNLLTKKRFADCGEFVAKYISSRTEIAESLPFFVP